MHYVYFEKWFNSPESGLLMIWLLILILLVSKIYLHYRNNRNIHRNRILKEKICPFCGTLNDINSVQCKKCDKAVHKNQKDVVCHHCGSIGDMQYYRKNTEFVVTILLWAVLTFPAIIYYFLFYNRRICNNCGRMTHGRDYRF